MAKPTGIVSLCANAIIDNNYSSTIDFKDANEQNAYWRSLVKYSITDFSYIRRTQQFIKVAKNLRELEDINYMYFQAQENNKLYYCFITSKEYVDDSSSYIYFETDVLQTYMFDYSVKQSFVVQEHVDRWTVDYKPIYSLTDEGLNYGSEYVTESAYKIHNQIDVCWYLLITKTGHNIYEGFNSQEPTTSYTTSIPYVYYLVPSFNSYDSYNTIVYYYEGSAVKSDMISNISGLNMLMGTPGEDFSNFIVQIIKLPYLPYDFEYGSLQGLSGYMLHIPEKYKNTFTTTKITETHGFIRVKHLDGLVNIFDVNGFDRYKPPHRKLAEMDIFEGISNALPTKAQFEEIKKNPYFIERDRRFESKLLCYPYRYNVLTDWKNNPIIIKNEYIGSDKIQVNHIQGIGYNAPARYWVDKYRKDPEGRYTSLIQLTQEDAPILTDAYATYMLQNRNQLQADRTNNMINAVVNVGSGIGAGAIAGGMTGGVYGAVGGAVVGGAKSFISGAIGYQALVRDQNAKQQDLKNLPDNIVSNNDIAFNNQDGNNYVCLYRKKICCEFEEMLADVFTISGYTVKRMKVPNLKSRLRYNYIKTLGANIVGSFNQEDLTKIKAIFDNGITFWHYNTVNFKPFDYSYENIERSLI